MLTPKEDGGGGKGGTEGGFDFQRRMIGKIENRKGGKGRWRITKQTAKEK